MLFHVNVSKTTDITMDIEADSEEEAREIALSDAEYEDDFANDPYPRYEIEEIWCDDQLVNCK